MDLIHHHILIRTYVRSTPAVRYVPMFIHHTWSKYHVLAWCLSLQPYSTGVGVLMGGRHSISCGQLSHTPTQTEKIPHSTALAENVCGVRNVVTQYRFMCGDGVIQHIHATSGEASYTRDVAHEYVARLQHATHFRARCSYCLWPQAGEVYGDIFILLRLLTLLRTYQFFVLNEHSEIITS